MGGCLCIKVMFPTSSAFRQKQILSQQNKRTLMEEGKFQDMRLSSEEEDVGGTPQ